MADTTHFDYVIIGAGFAGMCMGIKLKQAGLTNFVILDRNSHLGGTWWDNSYPGAACDVESHLYSFSFEPNPNWSRQFGPQKEILGYMDHCAEKYGLNDSFRFNTTVTGAKFDENKAVWQVSTSTGITYVAPVVVSCSGGLSQPALPNIKGLNDFKGAMFHTARWDHSYDLTDKTVGIIGTGASAIQVIPAIAPKVKKLDVFQRTPAWVIEKPDRPITDRERRLFKAMPWLQKFHRMRMYWMHELFATGFVVNPAIMRMVTKLATKFIAKSVKDETLREKLTPRYTIGCKRILLSNEYYPALQRENVEVITDGIQEINATGVLTKDGKQHDVDAIVLATGFYAAEGMLVYDVKGLNGADLNERWKEGAEAYLGTTIAGFPNLFLVIGPNTGLGHSSIILMIEAQVNYIMGAINTLRKENAKWVDVKPEAQKAFNDDLQQQLKKTVWQSGGCVSWYQTAQGKNVTLWPGYTFTFIQRTIRFKPEAYNLVK